MEIARYLHRWYRAHYDPPAAFVAERIAWADYEPGVWS